MFANVENTEIATIRSDNYRAVTSLFLIFLALCWSSFICRVKGSTNRCSES